MDISRKRSFKNRLLIFLFLIALSVLYYCTRFFMDGIPHYKNQDTYFHINRLIGLGNAWESPVSFRSFLGNGTYVNLFYPWLTMYPMRIFYKLCRSYVMAYKLFYLFLGTITVLISYQSMKQITHDDWSSICFAALYLFSSYRFANVYIRAALGESVAMAFLPLVLSGMYLIFWGDQRRWRILSIGIALISYTHLLSLFLAAGVTALLGVITFPLWDHKKERVTCFIKAIFSSMVLSFGSLIPMIIAASQNSVCHPDGSIDALVESADSLSDIISNSISNLPSYHSVGLLIIAAAAGFLLLIMKGEPSEAKIKTSSRIFYVTGLTAMIFASSLIPWRLIGRFPLFRIIQFTWRLNTYASLFIAFAFAMILSARNRHAKLPITAAVCITGIILTWSSVFTLHAFEERRITDEMISEMKTIQLDYSPNAAKSYFDQNGYTLDSFYLDGKQVTPDTSISQSGTKMYVNINNVKKDSVMDIPIYWFTTLKAKVNGEYVKTVMSERGTVLLTIPGDGDITIELFHTYPKGTYALWAASACFLIILIATNKRKITLLPRR